MGFIFYETRKCAIKQLTLDKMFVGGLEWKRDQLHFHVYCSQICDRRYRINLNIHQQMTGYRNCGIYTQGKNIQVEKGMES